MARAEADCSAASGSAGVSISIAMPIARAQNAINHQIRYDMVSGAVPPKAAGVESQWRESRQLAQSAPLNIS